jgi:hypothetical protein
MTRRLLFIALAAGLLSLSLGSLNARAGFIPLPTTLDQLLPAGNFTTVAAPGETDTFSNFSFSSSAIPPTTPVLAAGQLNVAPFTLGNEGGLEFSGAMFAPAGTIVDYKISFVVTAPVGSLISDAFLGVTYNVPNGSTGLVSIGESLFNASSGAPIGSLSVSSPPGTIGDTINFQGVQSILVKKDIFLLGGSLGAGVSIIDQGFSSTGVPEPASMALLGIGLTGFLTFRRFFKRTANA